MNAGRPADLGEGPSTPESGSEARRVLLVEDNVVSQRIAQLMLVDQGLAVDVASHGHEALALLERTRYDLVLVNVRMPDLDGLQVTAEIRRREGEGPRRVPIVALGTEGEPDECARCLAAGMDGYLRKPLLRHELERTLREHLPARGVAPAGPRGLVGVLPSAGSACDLAWLRETFDHDEDAVHSLVEMFLVRGPELLTTLQADAASGDVGALRFHAHAFKGVCGAIGAMQLHAWLSREPSELVATLAGLEQAFDELCALLEREVVHRP
jgi:CheY-like chemotaxis protein